MRISFAIPGSPGGIATASALRASVSQTQDKPAGVPGFRVLNGKFEGKTLRESDAKVVSSPDQGTANVFAATAGAIAAVSQVSARV